MPDLQLHSEPFVHLVDLSHDKVLIAWGAFCFQRRHPDQRWEIVDDEQLPEIAGRRTCIGSSAEPFGAATVEVLDADGATVAQSSTDEATWVWITGLAADTEYRYRITIDGEEWAAGERWDWIPSRAGGYDLAPGGRHYDLRFRTWPAPDAPTPEVRFVALGDYGVGIRSDAESSRRQRRIAAVLDTLVEQSDLAFVISLGDNIYQGEQGQVDDESGGEDDDWYSSFFQPYRYALARVPVYPAIGNHDTTDSEGSDDRAQMEDNFHLKERFRNEDDRSSVGPGLFYRLSYGRDVELICVDTSHDSSNEGAARYFQEPHHLAWLRDLFAAPPVRWRIPFSHHPAYCAGPHHGNDLHMIESLVPLFRTGGVRLALAGHEHNFQFAQMGGCTYVVSGAGGKVREHVPDGFGSAGTRGWAAQAHLLLVELTEQEARLTPVAGLLPDGSLHPMTALDARNQILRPPFVVARS
jgi:tartrate-resistant acid phosphatase type 5